jgi:hypothetical protein
MFVEMDVDKYYLQTAILDEKKNIPNYMEWLQEWKQQAN